MFKNLVLIGLFASVSIAQDFNEKVINLKDNVNNRLSYYTEAPGIYCEVKINLGDEASEKSRDVYEVRKCILEFEEYKCPVNTSKRIIKNETAMTRCMNLNRMSGTIARLANIKELEKDISCHKEQ